MAKIINDVQYVHAAAHDIVRGATAPSKWYRVDDVVKVDIAGASSVFVKLTLADEVAGAFEGEVVTSSDPRCVPGDAVSFNFQK